MMNNVHYIVQKIKGSPEFSEAIELGRLFEEINWEIPTGGHGLPEGYLGLDFALFAGLGTISSEWSLFVRDFKKWVKGEV